MWTPYLFRRSNHSINMIVKMQMSQKMRSGSFGNRTRREGHRKIYAPVAVAKGSATTKSDCEVENESLAQLSSDSRDGSDGHLQSKDRMLNTMVSVKVAPVADSRCRDAMDLVTIVGSDVLRRTERRRYEL